MPISSSTPSKYDSVPAAIAASKFKQQRQRSAGKETQDLAGFPPINKGPGYLSKKTITPFQSSANCFLGPKTSPKKLPIPFQSSPDDECSSPRGGTTLGQLSIDVNPGRKGRALQAWPRPPQCQCLNSVPGATV